MYGKVGELHPSFGRDPWNKGIVFMAKENHPLWNKSHSEETKLKISKSNYGKKRTEEDKQKASVRNSGKGNPMYGKTGENSPLYGRKRPEHAEWVKQNFSKTILDIMTGVYFNGTVEASIAYGINRSTLKGMLNGSNKNRTNLMYC